MRTFLTIFTLLLLVGCGRAKPPYERGDITFYFRDSGTKEPITKASVVIEVSLVPEPYSKREWDIQWLRRSTPPNKDGTVRESDIQFARYFVKIDSEGYDLQGLQVNLEEKENLEWRNLTISRKFPLHPERKIQFRYETEKQ